MDDLQEVLVMSEGWTKWNRSLIFPGMGIGFPLAFAWPCFGRICKGSEQANKKSTFTINDGLVP